MQALKVAVYSSTAALLAGAFALIPALSFLGLVGLYSVYLLYLGLPVLMKVDPGKSLNYTVSVTIAAAVLFAMIGGVSNAFIR